MQLQMAPDGTSAEFVGRTVDDGVAIQPSLVQVRGLINTTTEQAADDARGIFAATLRHLATEQLFNLGIRLVYNAPMPDNDARSFVLRRVLSAEDDGLTSLAAGSQGLWGGVKYVVPLPDRHYTLAVEPLQMDQMRSLFIDLDAQFPGEATVESITSRAGEAQAYITGPVDRYLDELLELQ